MLQVTTQLPFSAKIVSPYLLPPKKSFSKEREYSSFVTFGRLKSETFWEQGFGKVDVSEFICCEIKLESLTVQACLSLGLFCAYPE